MKRIILIFSCVLCALTVSAQTIGEAFYIYRNDGNFNAFFREEIDSIVYSCYDVDSTLYDDIVTQVVFTEDSVYRIPLEAIDSVSFVQPETKYKPGVIRLEGDILNYIISQDSLSIFFEAGTPSNILPRVGDKLITMEMTDIFPIGFAGEVINVKSDGDKVEIACTAVNLLDIFEQYYGSSEMEWDGQKIVRRNPSAPRKATGAVPPKTFQPGKLTLPLIDNIFSHSYQPNDNLAFTLDELSADISVTPIITGKGFWIIDARNGIYLQLSINGKYSLEENFGMKGSANWRQNKRIVRVPWPILPLADVYLELGGFVEAKGEFGIQQKWTQEYKSVFTWDYSSKGENVLKPVNKMIPVSSNHSGEATIKGSIGAGVYLQVGLDFIHTKKLDIANVNLEGRAGVCLEGNLVLDKSDMETAKKSTAIYESLRDTYLSLNWYLGASANASILKYGVSREFDLGGLPFKTHGEIARFCLAPTFTDVKASYSKESTSIIDAQAKISCPAMLGGRCIKVDAGLVLKDELGENFSTNPYEINDYKGSIQAKVLDSQFQEVPSNKKLRVYPHIKWMGGDILASPYAEINCVKYCPDGNHPHWIDLGLSSGTLWRCCNQGALSPIDCGSYYSYDESKEYNLPTLAQIMELIEYCTSELETANGMNGIIYIGPNSNSIFLPFAGFRYERDEDNERLSNVGNYGYFWSSMPISRIVSTGKIFWGADSSNWTDDDAHGKDAWGQSIRCVR